MRDTIVEHTNELGHIKEATGLAVAIRGKLVSIDVFDKAETCAKIWERVLAGCVVDAVRKEEDKVHVTTASDIENVLQKLVAQWHATVPLGEGHEFRANTNSGGIATVLVCQDTMLHGSALFD